MQIALMALKMMELSDEVMSPHGEPIKVGRIPQKPLINHMLTFPFHIKSLFFF